MFTIIIRPFSRMAILLLFSFQFQLKAQSLKGFSLNAIEIRTGASILLGDLGGSGGVGSIGLKDLDLPATRYSAGMSAVWSNRSRFSVKGQLQYAQLHGSDKFSEEKYRRRRNITVTTQTASLVLMGEYKGSIGKNRNRMEALFYGVHGGTGVLLFQPTAIYNGRTFALQPLGTEGQNLHPELKPYSRVTAVVPFGLSLGYQNRKDRSYSLEITGYKTFSDYLDDVSRSYYHSGRMRERRGDVAAYLADPNTTGRFYEAGTKRGNPERKDHFFCVSLVCRYPIHTRPYRSR